MSSLLVRSLAAKKGCPFCNFEPCHMEKCMFFLAPPGRDFDCIMFENFTNGAASSAYSQRIGLLLGLENRPAIQSPDPSLLAATHDRLEEILESLETAKASPILSDHARAKLEKACDSVASSRREVRLQLDAVSPAVASEKKRGARKTHK